MLDARRLQALHAVVETGSITEAAAALGYTASAVSQSVAALEREAKTPLFERSGRGIRPTQAGLLLAQHAGAVMAQLRGAEEALEAFRAGQAGRLRVAAFATAGTVLVPRALARFKESHAGVELDLKMAEADEALTQLSSGLIDLAVVGEDEPPEHRRADAFLYTHLLDDPYRLVLPANTAAGSRRDGVELESLKEEPWISTASARCDCLETVTETCARAGFTPRFTLEADEFATTIGFVAAGLGVAMVPLLALSSVPDEVRVCRIRRDEPKRYVYAVTRAAGAQDGMVQAMIEALHTSAHAHLQKAA